MRQLVTLQFATELHQYPWAILILPPKPANICIGSTWQVEHHPLVAMDMTLDLQNMPVLYIIRVMGPLHVSPLLH